MKVLLPDDKLLVKVLGQTNYLYAEIRKSTEMRRLRNNTVGIITARLRSLGDTLRVAGKNKFAPSKHGLLYPGPA